MITLASSSGWRGSDTTKALRVLRGGRQGVGAVEDYTRGVPECAIGVDLGDREAQFCVVDAAWSFG